MQKEPAVLFETINKHIGLITINRPKARNAVNGELAQGIAKYLDQTEADDDIWNENLDG